MRTITLLCAAALCTLPHTRNLNAHPFEPQDSPVVVGDTTVPIHTEGQENGKKKTTTPAKQKQDNAKTLEVGHPSRAIKHQEGFTTVAPGLYFVKDRPRQANVPVCFEICSGLNCTHEFVPLNTAKSWSLALNDEMFVDWPRGQGRKVLINTGSATINNGDISDSTNRITSAALTIDGKTRSLPTGNYTAYALHYCTPKGGGVFDCSQNGDNKDHCKP